MIKAKLTFALVIFVALCFSFNIVFGAPETTTPAGAAGPNLKECSTEAGCHKVRLNISFGET